MLKKIVNYEKIISDKKLIMSITTSTITELELAYNLALEYEEHSKNSQIYLITSNAYKMKFLTLFNIIKVACTEHEFNFEDYIDMNKLDLGRIEEWQEKFKLFM